MSKDEQIQQLREQLARAEGERDAYKAIASRRPEVVTTPPRPLWPAYGYVCASCGQWATAGHYCITWNTPKLFSHLATYTTSASTSGDQPISPLTARSHPVLAAIWDNPDDAIFDAVEGVGEGNE